MPFRNLGLRFGKLLALELEAGLLLCKETLLKVVLRELFLETLQALGDSLLFNRNRLASGAQLLLMGLQTQLRLFLMGLETRLALL